MFQTPLRALARVLPALAIAVSVLALAGCQRPYPSQTDARFTLASTQPSGTYQPGDDVTFHVTVTNSGTRDVHFVSISTVVDPDLQVKSYTCTGLGLEAPTSGKAPGPASCTYFIYLDKLAAGATATIDVVATVHTASKATATNTVSVDAASGPATASTSNTVTLADHRGGAYRAFTSAGQTLSVTADFSAATLTFSGGAVAALPFKTVFDDETYTLAGNALFRTPHDLLVGTADLGDGARPFIAARKFVTSLAALDGLAFNAFVRDTPASGSATTRVQTLRFSGATMQVCADATPHAIAACPPASLHQYDLSLADDVFTGVDAAHAETVTFEVAQSDSALVLLRAEATATGRTFQVGLSTNAGIGAVGFQGGDTLGRSGTLTLAQSTLSSREAFEPDFTEHIDGTLAAIAGGPAGLLAGTLGDDASTTWLAQDGPLAVVVGQPGTSLDGLLQLYGS